MDSTVHCPGCPLSNNKKKKEKKKTNSTIKMTKKITKTLNNAKLK